MCSVKLNYVIQKTVIGSKTIKGNQGNDYH